MANNYDAMNEIYFAAAIKKSKAYTDSEVAKVRNKFQVVASYEDLPTVGDENTIYLVPTGSDNVYEQYIYDGTTSSYVDIGDTTIDLDEYATDEELDARVSPLEELADNFSVENGKLCYVVSEGNSDSGEFMTSYEDLNQLMTKNTGIGLSENGDLMTELSQAGNVSVFIKTGYSNNPYLARFYAQDDTSSISSENIVITETLNSIEIVNTSSVNIMVEFYSKNASDLWDGFVTDPMLQTVMIPANSMATVEYVGVYLDGEFFDNLYRNKPLALDETLQDLVDAVEQIAENVSTVVESTVSTQVAEQLPSAVEDQISPIVEEQVEDQIDDVVAAKLPAEVTRQISTPVNQAVNTYCAANFSEWAGGLDSTLTQPLMAAPANKVGKIKSALSSFSMSMANKIPTPATLAMFEKKIFDTNIGFAPQGLAVNGKYAYVVNGFTEPRNVIGEINLETGAYTVHTVTGYSSYGGNCATIDYEKNILYVADHGNTGYVYAINLSDFTLIDRYTKTKADNTTITYWNIAFDPYERVFYTAMLARSQWKFIIYKLDENFHEISHVETPITDTGFPTHNAGTDQGFGFDGTFFYYCDSEVEGIDGNNFVHVLDKTGKYIKSYRGCHGEIEDVSYDFTTGKFYTSYAAVGETGYITESVIDSGWLDLMDYVSNDYDSYAVVSNIESTAKIRLRNGNLIIRGTVKINSLASNMSGVMTYLESRLAPVEDILIIVPYSSTNSLTDTIPKVINISYSNEYVDKNKYLYVPITFNLTGSVYICQMVEAGRI